MTRPLRFRIALVALEALSAPTPEQRTFLAEGRDRPLPSYNFV